MVERLLVAVAFDDLAEPVVRDALALARSTGASCTLLHVVEALEGDDEETVRFHERLEREAGLRLEPHLAPFREAGVPCEARVEIDRSWRAILDVADEVDADVIVIGSRPTVESGRPHLGSTSHQVFFAADRRLLVVRRPGG